MWSLFVLSLHPNPESGFSSEHDIPSSYPQLFFEIAIRVFDYNEDFSQNMLLDFPVTYAVPFQVLKLSILKENLNPICITGPRVPSLLNLKGRCIRETGGDDRKVMLLIMWWISGDCRNFLAWGKICCLNYATAWRTLVCMLDSGFSLVWVSMVPPQCRVRSTLNGSLVTSGTLQPNCQCTGLHAAAACFRGTP